MASDKGFPSKDREVDRLVEEGHVTSQPIREKQIAKDVISHFSISSIGTDAVEADSSKYLIKATAHLAKVGDVIKFTSGNLQDQEVKVIKVDTDEFEIGELLSEAPATSDTFEIFRHTYLQANNGALNVNAVQTPVKFRLDGSEQEVVEDTVTPANNAPLPVKLTSTSGDINITAGDLNVQTSHVGASHDSMRIGDGTETLEITASGEANTFDSTSHTKLDSANATLTSLDGKDYATQTTLAALLTELQLKADLTETQPVSAASLPLPTGASTEAKQDSAITQLTSIAGEDFATSAKQDSQTTLLTSLDGKDYATQTTLAALLVELQAKADLSETQPVSAASLPLPSGAATEATLASLDGKDFATQTTLAALLTELQLKADLTETQPVSLASQPLPTGAATEAKQDNAITQLTSIAGEDFATQATLATVKADTNNIKGRLSQTIETRVRHDYSSVNVTTGADVNLFTYSGGVIRSMHVFDSSGETLILKVGGSDSTYIVPGGNGYVPIIINNGQDVDIRAVSANATVGELTITFYKATS